MSLIKWAPLFILGAAMESTTQLCLKKGALAHQETGGLAYYLKLIRNKWVITGILSYVVEMVIWIVLLSYIPLSIAFPLTGLQKIFIILFSVFILKERVSRIEWLGVGVTALGIAVIGQS
ncbi:MAG: EamA family transporter [Nitrospirae bacterium]|nr:EamA family transporter [Nitrospirota bacterium]MCL5238523.1 EamA family transporter [Nitrospirota bacterium]